jgi:hypothetical protein
LLALLVEITIALRSSVFGLCGIKVIIAAGALGTPVLWWDGR